MSGYTEGPTPEMRKALLLAESALAHEKSDCWATGPKTGDPVLDFIACPGCAALYAIRVALDQAYAR